MSLFLYVCEANLWTLDAPGYCEGDLVRDRLTPARCVQARPAPLPVHVWDPNACGPERWRAPVLCEIGGDAWYTAWWRDGRCQQERRVVVWVDGAVDIRRRDCRPT